MDDSEDEQATGEDSHLQACYLLQPGNAAVRSRKKRPKHPSETEPLPICLENEPEESRRWRMHAFQAVWNSIETAARDTLEKQNAATFKNLELWINNSRFCKAQLNLYTTNSSMAKRLSTALMFSGAVDSSDARGILESLSTFLREQNRCHLAQLQPHDFVHGVNGPLRSLFKQFIGVIPETTDMEVLAAWHQDNQLPFVVIVEDAERCSGSILAELLVILSEWTTEIPFLLVFGMSTTQDALRRLLPSSVLGRLQPEEFILRSPLDRLEGVIREALIGSSYPFFLEHDVAKLAYEYFFTHDNSVTCFLRILKISCMEHFCRQPLSFLCEKAATSETLEDLEGFCSKLPPTLLQYASRLSSYDSSSISIAEALWNWKKNRKLWSMGLQCFLAAGRRLGYAFHDVFCAALKDENRIFLSEIIEKMRGVPFATCSGVVEEWMLLDPNNDELKTLQEQMVEAKSHSKATANTSAHEKLPCSPSKMTRRMRALIGEPDASKNSGSPGSTSSNKAPELHAWKRTLGDFLERMQSYVTAFDTLSLREVFGFKDVTLVKEALTGDTRKNVHLDLTCSQNKLRCKCCLADGSPTSSVHDTALAYMLSLEHNELVNVHDWFQSFETVSSQAAAGKSTSTPAKRGLKRKMSFGFEDKAVTQARFSRAVAELHVTGLFRLPKKRNPDSLQRVSFGI